MSAGNISTGGAIQATGNITGANIVGAHYGAGNNLSNIQGANVTGNVTSAITANFANFAGNVTIAAQPNITSVGTLTSLTVTGNTTSGNLITGGSVTATGNVSGGNVTTVGNVIGANITANNTLTTANLNATGANVSLGAVGNVKITGGTSGQYLQTNGSGTLTWATVSATAESIANGTSNLGFTASNGNLIGGIAGTANAFFVSDSMFAVKSEDIIIGKGTDSTVTANRGRVVIGNTAGSLTQGVAGIAIGSGSGKNQTGLGAISIGAGSGYISQGATAVALGYGAGFSGAQGAGGIAIGGNAAFNGQGANSVAIGYHSGKGTGGQPNNSIVINASGVDFNATVANSFFVNPVRNDTGNTANVMYYNAATKEVTYAPAATGSSNAIVNGTSNISISTAGGGITGYVGGAPAINMPSGFSGKTVLGINANAGDSTTSIGSGAGSGAGTNSVHVGFGAGALWSNSSIVAIGCNIGGGGAGSGTVIIGQRAAFNQNLGINSIVIGNAALNGGTAANTIVLNATGTGLTTAGATADSFYVAPIRNATAANVVYYNPTTKEMTYGADSSPTSLVNGTSNVVVAASGNVTVGVAGTANVISATSLAVSITGGLSVSGASSFGPVNETFTSLTGATGVVVHNVATSHVFNHTSIAASFTVNLTGLTTAIGQATVITLMLNQGATAFISNALQIGGVAQTIKWQGGTAPLGNANKLDAVAFTIFRTAASTYVVTGQLVSYG